jgi:hypothetical protein
MEYRCGLTEFMSLKPIPELFMTLSNSIDERGVGEGDALRLLAAPGLVGDR